MEKYSTSVNKNIEKVLIPAKQMKIGEIGMVKRAQNESNVDAILIRTFNKIVCLNDVNIVFDTETSTIFVELLPKGSTVTLTVK